MSGNNKLLKIKITGTFLIAKFNFQNMINIYSFLNSIFKIKNSKILILILMCSFTSQSLSKSEPRLSNYESYKLKDKTFKNINYNLIQLFLIQIYYWYKIFENNEYLTNNHTNSNLDFKKLEENTDKDFLKMLIGI